MGVSSVFSSLTLIVKFFIMDTGLRELYFAMFAGLATVIGVKCMSPGTDGKPTMKVKSYVSDLHKELFELASLYWI